MNKYTIAYNVEVIVTLECSPEDLYSPERITQNLEAGLKEHLDADSVQVRDLTISLTEVCNV